VGKLNAVIPVFDVPVIVNGCVAGEPVALACVATILIEYEPSATTPLVTRLLPLVVNDAASVPVTDSEPEKAGAAGDIVTDTPPTTVPLAAPPGKDEFERLTAVIDWVTPVTVNALEYGVLVAPAWVYWMHTLG